MDGGLGSGIPHEKIYVKIHALIKTARRKVASAMLSRRESGQFGARWNWPLGCFGIRCLLGHSGLGGAKSHSGVVSNGGCFQSFGGGLLTQVGRGSF